MHASEVTKITPDFIHDLQDNEVFVFGSNTAGNHAGGAALTALRSFGAMMNVGVGMQGQSYAIPTLDSEFHKLSIDVLTKYVAQFMDYALTHPDNTFFVTRIGCGIAGFTVAEIKGIFHSMDIPENVYLPQEFIS